MHPQLSHRDTVKMKVERVYVKPGAELSNRLMSWASINNLESNEISLEENFDELIDGLVIFNQNQDVDRDLLEIRKVFDDRQKPVQRIDINGTLMVGVSNFSLWLERNGCRNILMVGSDQLCENPNLDRYLEHLKIA